MDVMIPLLLDASGMITDCCILYLSKWLEGLFVS